MKKTLFALLTATILMAQFMASAGSAWAAQDDEDSDSKPLVVVSIAGYDSLKKDLAFLGEISGNPQMAQSLEQALQLFTGGQGLAGLDNKRPWGAAVTTNGVAMPVLAFVPVKDLDKLMGALGGLLQEPEKNDDDVWEVTLDNASVFIVESDGWAFIAQSEDALEDLPEDPMDLLGDLPKDYDIAVQLSIQNIPEQFRAFGLDQIKAGLEEGMERMPEESDAQYELRKSMAKSQIASIETMFNELDQITVGWTIDGEARNTYIDMNVTAVEGTATAKQLAYSSKTPSKLTGFVQEDAVVTGHSNSTIGEAEIAQALVMLKGLREQLPKELEKSDDIKDPADKKLLQKLGDSVLSVFEATIKKGHLNGGIIVTGEGPFNLVAGSVMTDTAKLEATLKEGVKALEKKDKNFPKTKFDVAKYKDVNFHVTTIEIPAEGTDEQQAAVKKFLGEKLTITLGIGKETIFVAIGEDGQDLIKSVVDASTTVKDLPLGNFSVALAPFFKAVSELDQQNPIVGMMAQSLSESEDDHLLLTVEATDDGVRYRYLAEEGVLKLMGVAAQLAAQQGGAGAIGPPVEENEAVEEAVEEEAVEEEAVEEDAVEEEAAEEEAVEEAVGDE